MKEYPRIVTLSGDIVDFGDATSVHAISLEECLWLLSRERRFGNRLDTTVLQHLIFTGFLAEHMFEHNIPLIQHSYFHDIQEAFLRDVPTPFKKAVGSAWYEMEDEIQRILYARFGLCNTLGDEDEEVFARIDNLACYIEGLMMCPEAPDFWQGLANFEFTTQEIILATELFNVVLKLEIVDEQGYPTENTVQVFKEVICRGIM